MPDLPKIETIKLSKKVSSKFLDIKSSCEIKEDSQIARYLWELGKMKHSDKEAREYFEKESNKRPSDSEIRIPPSFYIKKGIEVFENRSSNKFPKVLIGIDAFETPILKGIEYFK